MSNSESLRHLSPKCHKMAKTATPKTGERVTTSGTLKEAGKSTTSTSGEEIKALIRSTVLEVLRDIVPPKAAKRLKYATCTRANTIHSLL